MKLLYGNLKMNFLYKDFMTYLDRMRLLTESNPPKTIVGLAVPYIYLKAAADKIGANVKILAQDLCAVDKGAFTSQISAAQVASLEVPATLIGHSECRKLSQNAIVIANKVRAALDCGLEVIYCCGADPLQEIQDELKALTEEDFKRIIIAYEPIGAIGTGKAASAESAEDMLMRIKKDISKYWNVACAANARYIYGGSVNYNNYHDYLNMKNIDGVLVGGASLNIEEFWKMATLQ